MGHRSNAMNELGERFSRIGHTGRMGESFTRIASAVRALEDLNVHRDVTMPQEHHTAKVGRAAQQLQLRLTSLKDAALSAYSSESGRISGLIIERLNMKESRFGEELRRLIVSMPASDRIQYVADLAKDPEAGPMLAALTGAPALLHGVPRDVLKAAEDSFISLHAPDLVAMQQDLDAALSLASAAHRTAEVMSREYQDTKALERIAQAEAAAREAQQRMSEALA